MMNNLIFALGGGGDSKRYASIPFAACGSGAVNGPVRGLQQWCLGSLTRPVEKAKGSEERCGDGIRSSRSIENRQRAEPTREDNPSEDEGSGEHGMHSVNSEARHLQGANFSLLDLAELCSNVDSSVRRFGLGL